MSYLLDTNVLSELVSKNPNQGVIEWFDAIPDESLYLSVLSLGEIRKGVAKIENLRRKNKLLIWLENDLPGWFEDRILSIDQAVADRWGRLEYEVKRTLPAIDGLLAATALHHDLEMVTRNEKDFELPGLTVINPWKLK